MQKRNVTVSIVDPQVSFVGIGNYYNTQEEDRDIIDHGYVRTVRLIESAARNCYLSNMSKDFEKGEQFVRSLGKRGHTSTFEHVQVTLLLHQPDYISRVIDFLVTTGRYRWFDLLRDKYMLYLSGNFRAWYETINDIVRLKPVNHLGLLDPFIFVQHLFAPLFSEEVFEYCRDLDVDYRRFDLVERLDDIPTALLRLVFHVKADRAVTMEWNRHKMLSISQESQRYVAYEKRGFKFMKIPEFEHDASVNGSVKILLETCSTAYLLLRELNYAPEIARAVLPNCAMTSVYYSALYPFWDHFVKMRVDSHAHPHIRKLAKEIEKNISKFNSSTKCGWAFTDLCRD